MYCVVYSLMAHTVTNLEFRRTGACKWLHNIGILRAWHTFLAPTFSILGSTLIDKVTPQAFHGRSKIQGFVETIQVATRLRVSTFNTRRLSVVNLPYSATIKNLYHRTNWDQSADWYLQYWLWCILISLSTMPGPQSTRSVEEKS